MWQTVASLLSELDVLLGFADLAACSPAPYVRPTMLGAECGELVLRGARHPCVEAQEARFKASLSLPLAAPLLLLLPSPLLPTTQLIEHSINPLTSSKPTENFTKPGPQTHPNPPKI